MPDVRLVEFVLVKMSTGRLLEQSDGIENGTRLLVVLLLQVHRVHGHDLLCSAKEEQPHLDVARDSPRLHANVGLVRRQVHARWSQHVLWSTEHLRPYRDVLVLPSFRLRPEDSTLSLVEEIPDESANDSIRSRDDPRLPIALCRLQLSEGVRLVDRLARRHVLLLVP